MHPLQSNISRNLDFSTRRSFSVGGERDGKTGFEAFELRSWDGRIGRWKSPDLYGQFHSTYLGMGNNPISAIDPDGGLIYIIGPGGQLLNVGLHLYGLTPSAKMNNILKTYRTSKTQHMILSFGKTGTKGGKKIWGSATKTSQEGAPAKISFASGQKELTLNPGDHVWDIKISDEVYDSPISTDGDKSKSVAAILTDEIGTHVAGKTHEETGYKGVVVDRGKFLLTQTMWQNKGQVRADMKYLAQQFSAIPSIATLAISIGTLSTISSTGALIGCPVW